MAYRDVHLRGHVRKFGPTTLHKAHPIRAVKIGDRLVIDGQAVQVIGLPVERFECFVVLDSPITLADGKQAVKVTRDDLEALAKAGRCERV
jgi:hypothetical protein